MSQNANAARIEIDWSTIGSVNEFYDLVFKQCHSPEWHGRSLDAIADSWIAGGVNESGPPYVFTFLCLKRTAPDLIQLRDAVLGIAQESIDENGGLLETSDEQ